MEKSEKQVDAVRFFTIREFEAAPEPKSSRQAPDETAWAEDAKAAGSRAATALARTGSDGG